jgi:thymidylate kinase
MNKPFLIYEGIDKTGKTTLIKEFHKATNFQYSCIDRFSGTSYAYGKFRNRRLNYDNYFKNLRFNNIFIKSTSSKQQWNRLK